MAWPQITMIALLALSMGATISWGLVVLYYNRGWKAVWRDAALVGFGGLIGFSIERMLS